MPALSRLICLLTLAAALSCSGSAGVVVPNEHSQARGARGIQADASECVTYAVLQERRLLGELHSYDPYLEKQARRNARGKSVGASVGKSMGRSGSSAVISRKSNKQKNKEKRAAAAGALVGGAVWDMLTSDASKRHLERMETYLDFFSTHMVWKHTCLRAKGYRVDEDAEYGSGYPVLEFIPQPKAVEVRLVLREADCTGVVQFNFPEPDGVELPIPAESDERCVPAVLATAPVSAGPPAGADPRPRLEPLGYFTEIDTRSDLETYLGGEGECVDSRSGYQLCSWRNIGKSVYAWNNLSAKTATKHRVNVFCEIPVEGSIRFTDHCQTYPAVLLGRPVLTPDAQEEALARVSEADGMAQMSGLVGDGPVGCTPAFDGDQQCHWTVTTQKQGYGLFATAAQTRRATSVDCRFSPATGATIPETCEVTEKR